MNASPQTAQRIGRFAWVMAWVGLVVGQLHALSRFATLDGREDLEYPLTRAWAVPADNALRPLLDWAAPDAVYLTYGKIWLPVFVAFTLCAFVVYARRRPTGVERWAWRLALVGYVWACVGVACDYWTQWATPNAFFDIAFMITVPGLLLTLLGSTVLGITLLLKGFRPWPPALLLALMIPLAMGILQVTSMGSVALPVMFAFGILGRKIASPLPEQLLPLVDQQHDGEATVEQHGPADGDQPPALQPDLARQHTAVELEQQTGVHEHHEPVQ